MNIFYVGAGDISGSVIIQFGDSKLQLVSVSVDERRSIFELDTPEGTYQYFEIFTDLLPLGKHFHTKKDEEFTILSGEGFVLLCIVEEGGSQKGEVKKVDLTLGSVVKVPRGTAHTFYLSPGSSMACVSTVPFDEDDMHATEWLIKD